MEQLHAAPQADPTPPSLQQLPEMQPAPPPATQSKPSRRGPARCSHRTRYQGRCRLPVQDPAIGLCFRHAALARKDAFDDSEDLSAEILTHFPGTYATPESINAVLSNVIELVAAGRLSSRRAAVLTYALSLLLRSAVALDRMTEGQDKLPFDHVLRDIANGKAPGEDKPPFTPPATPEEAIAAYERLRS
jgi:hypothetical protein